MYETIKKHMIEILAVLFLVMFLISAGFNYNGSAKVRRITEEISIATGTGDIESNYKCNSTNAEYYCFSLTESKKTCYTLPDKQGGKRCLIAPYWEKKKDDIVINQPTHKCAANGNELYCYSTSESKKTCYTGLYNTGGKRCLTAPYWEDIRECPECSKLSTCPVLNLTCPPQPCIQTCKGCGSGDGGSSDEDPKTECEECNDLIVLAYIPNDDCSYTDKWFCPGIGKEVKCINELDLSEKQLDELGW